MSAIALIDRTLQMSGLPGVDCFPERLDCCPPFATGHFLDGFGHADKKFHFPADWRMIGAERAALPPFPDHVAVIDERDAERPFRLVAAPSRSSTRASTILRRALRAKVDRRRSCTLKCWADWASAMAAGCASAIAAAVVHARAFDGLQKPVVIVEGLWPNHAFEEGIGINLLTSADPGLPRGGAVFHDTAVWLSPA
jgi:hypothetical protein